MGWRQLPGCHLAQSLMWSFFVIENPGERLRTVTQEATCNSVKYKKTASMGPKIKDTSCHVIPGILPKPLLTKNQI